MLCNTNVMTTCCGSGNKVDKSSAESQTLRTFRSSSCQAKNTNERVRMQMRCRGAVQGQRCVTAGGDRCLLAPCYDSCSWGAAAEKSLHRARISKCRRAAWVNSQQHRASAPVAQPCFVPLVPAAGHRVCASNCIAAAALCSITAAA